MVMGAFVPWPAAAYISRMGNRHPRARVRKEKQEKKNRVRLMFDSEYGAGSVLDEFI